MNYFTGDFMTADTILGINIEAADWNNGALGLTFKAIEMRLASTIISGCPNWTTGGLINLGMANEASVQPVPYLNNFPNLARYAFGAPFQVGALANSTTVVCCQYTPGQNIINPGCAAVGYDRSCFISCLWLGCSKPVM
jgi:hypothetical protein